MHLERKGSPRSLCLCPPLRLDEDEDHLRLNAQDFRGDVIDDPEAAGLFAPDGLGDQADFHNVVDDDHGMLENARQLDSDDTRMLSLIDALQCLGVDCETACTCASSIWRNKDRFHPLYRDIDCTHRLVGSLTGERPSFMELYGQ